MAEEVSFRAYSPADFEAAHDLYDQTIRAALEAEFGWDAPAQRKRLMDLLAVGETWWLVSRSSRSRRCGLVCVHPEDAGIHLRLLMIDSAHQRLGIGRAALKRCERRVASGRRVRLSCLESNTQALRFYAQQGYSADHRDGGFVALSKTITCEPA